MLYISHRSLEILRTQEIHNGAFFIASPSEKQHLQPARSGTRSLLCENCFLMLSLNFPCILNETMIRSVSRQLYTLLRLCNVIKKFDFRKLDIDTRSSDACDVSTLELFACTEKVLKKLLKRRLELNLKVSFTSALPASLHLAWNCFCEAFAHSKAFLEALFVFLLGFFSRVFVLRASLLRVPYAIALALCNTIFSPREKLFSAFCCMQIRRAKASCAVLYKSY